MTNTAFTSGATNPVWQLAARSYWHRQRLDRVLVATAAVRATQCWICRPGNRPRERQRDQASCVQSGRARAARPGDEDQPMSRIANGIVQPPWNEAGPSPGPSHRKGRPADTVTRLRPLAGFHRPGHAAEPPSPGTSSRFRPAVGARLGSNRPIRRPAGSRREPA